MEKESKYELLNKYFKDYHCTCTSKSGHYSENLLNKIRQIIYSLYRAKVVTKKYIKQYKEFNKGITQKGYYIYEF